MNAAVFQDARESGRLTLSNVGIAELDILDQAVIDIISEIDISKNQIEILSEGTVAQLGDIEVLDASSNKISMLPGLIPLISLTHLDLSRNKLVTVPDSIGTLASLIELQLSQNLLASLPRSIGQIVALELLDVSENQLDMLPPLGSLVNLTTLNVAHNQLTYIPRGIGACTALQAIDASTNRLERLPLSVRHLEHLESFQLSFNPLKEPPLNVCERGVRHITDWVKTRTAELRAAGGDDDGEAAVDLDDDDDLEVDTIDRGSQSFSPLPKRTKPKAKESTTGMSLLSSVGSSVGSFLGRVRTATFGRRASLSPKP